MHFSARWFSFLLTVLLSLTVSARSRDTVQGVVVDSKSHEALIGASVVVKGASIGVITDLDGRFKLEVPHGSLIVVSSIGYNTVEIADYNISEDLVVALKPDVQVLEDAVVIAYGKVRKEDATGAVVAIRPDEENKGLQLSPQQAIQGKVAGLYVVSSGGTPGAGYTMRIRGGSSLSASNDPLIIIDGMAIENRSVMGMNNIMGGINPNDIESFTVLKDASSTSIYGSRASNGVIIITTKRGRVGSGRMSINYNNNMSVSYNPKPLAVLSANELRVYIKEVMGSTFSSDGLGSDAVAGTGVTDWQKEIYRICLSQEHNLSLTGACFFMPYRISAGFTDQQGTIRRSNYKRYTSNITLSPYFFDKHLALDLNFKGSLEANQFVDPGIAANAAAFDPTKPVHANSKYGLGYFVWDDGSGHPIYLAPVNPVADIDLVDDRSKIYRGIANARFDYRIHGFENMRLILNLGQDRLWADAVQLVPDNSPQTWAYLSGNGQGVYRHIAQTKINSTLELYGNYSAEAGQHKLNLTGGYSWMHFVSSKDDNEKSTDLMKTFKGVNYRSEYFLVSFFGRLNYSFSSRYLLTATLRNDGSSVFSPKNRWGLFPSAALAWKINEEPFMNSQTLVSELKLRVSYGETGQQDFGSYYDWQPTYTLGDPFAQYQLGDAFITTLRPNGYSNLKWETTITYNLGLDYAFRQGRVGGSLDVYMRKTKDLLNKTTVAAGSNLTDVLNTNIGSMNNRGVEFSIHAIPVQRGAVVWDFDCNITYNQSKISKLILSDAPDYMVKVGPIDGATGANSQVHAVGYAPYTFYLRKQVYNSDGQPIEGEYEGEKEVITNKKPTPDLILGLASKIRYKRWVLGFNAHAHIGNYVFNNVRSMQYRDKVFGNNYFTNILQFTRHYGFDTPQYWSDYFLSNASFLKLDNLNLGYSFPNFGKNRGVSIRLTASVENLITVTKYQGLDPEVPNGIDRNMYARPRVYSLGITIKQ